MQSNTKQTVVATKANRRQKKALKSASKPVHIPVPTSSPDNIEEFQRAYADEWIRTVHSPVFRAALQLLNIEKLDSITNLSNEQIEKNGREILSDLKGHLQLENNLFTLHSRKEGKLPWEESEEYMPPEEIAQIEELKTKLRSERERNRYAI